MLTTRALRFTLQASTRAASNDVSSLPDWKVDKYSTKFAETSDYDSQVLKSSTERGIQFLVPVALTATMVPATLFGVKNLIRGLGPGRNVLALATTEVAVGDIPEGKCVTFLYRNKPLFVRHRSPAQIASAESVDTASLRDPQTDKERFKDQRYLICIGVCTHLGCVPLPDAGNFANGGFYCPCHGSHYDESGRIRFGPAPLNLEIPPLTWIDESNILVG